MAGQAAQRSKRRPLPAGELKVPANMAEIEERSKSLGDKGMRYILVRSNADVRLRGLGACPQCRQRGKKGQAVFIGAGVVMHASCIVRLFNILDGGFTCYVEAVRAQEREEFEEFRRRLEVEGTEALFGTSA